MGILAKIQAVLMAAVLFYCFTSLPAFAGTRYKIRLKSGKSLDVSSYWEEDNLIYYYKYGAQIGIMKSNVASITPVLDNSENIETVTLDKSFEKEARRSDQNKKRRVEQANAPSECEKKLKQTEQYVRIYCGKSESFAQNPGQLSVSAGSIRQIHDTSRTCSYYKNRLARFKKECN